MARFLCSNALWEDTYTQDELPAAFADLIAAGIPYTIEALPADDEDLEPEDWGHAVRWIRAHSEPAEFIYP